MCMIDEADEWTIYRRAERTARIEHTCMECGRKIAVGERYHWATGLIWDHWSVMKQCAQCAEAARWLVEVCRGYLYGSVAEDLAEHWAEDDLYRSLGLGRVIVSMRYGRRWQRNGELVPVERVRAWIDDALARVPAKARSDW